MASIGDLAMAHPERLEHVGVNSIVHSCRAESKAVTAKFF